MEITLRSRVIEKLSVALDMCLFRTQRDRDRCPETDGGVLDVEVRLPPQCIPKMNTDCTVTTLKSFPL